MLEARDVIDKPGVYDGIPMTRYLGDCCTEPSLSGSCAHTLLTRSPKHAYQFHPKLGGGHGCEASVADVGSAAHDLLLGGEGAVAVINPEDYPAANGNIPSGWTNPTIRAARDTARSSGLTPILAADYAEVERMRDAALEFVDKSEVAGVFKAGKSEQTVVWKDGGVWCRSRPDWLSSDTVLHYKSSLTSVRPESFIRGVMVSLGYGLTLRFYARGLYRLFPNRRYRHVILAQEQQAPYVCSLIGLSPAKEMIEDDRVERAIGLWSRCLATGDWPAFDGRVHYAEPAAWEIAQAEQAMEDAA